ncbi:MAG: hypothetical protein GY870_04330 [archaeon]|nr:hypothetical protein [archaeon]
MKYKLILFMFLLVFFSCEKDKKEYKCYIAKAADAYEYLVKPGTTEWEQLNSTQEMIDACQISFEILDNMSTEGLIESILNYPLYADLYLSNINVQAGFDAVSKNFNGIQILLQRKDAAIKLLERYRKMHPSCKENNWPSLVEPGRNNGYSFSFIEIIIAQYDILNQIIQANEYEIVMQEILIKDKQKVEFDYSVAGKQHSVLILGRIMYLCNYTPFMEEYNSNHYVKIFIDGASDFKTGTLDIVNEYAIFF